jgi:3-deoxy-D-manno-octulosonic-acid transferase
MGKSLLPGGGQNPIEPAKLGCAILYGPHVENFTEVYGELAAAKAAARVSDAASLARAAQYLLSDPARMRKMGRAAAETVEKLGGASRGIMTAVEPYLAQMAVAQQ